MLLDRPERIGFKPDEALVLLEHRNLKEEYNRYMNTFMEFVNYIESIPMQETNMTILKKLVKIYNETEELTKFIQNVVYDYEQEVDMLIAKQNKEEANKMFNKIEENRPLFSEETTKKIMAHIHDDPKIGVNKIKG